MIPSFDQFQKYGQENMEAAIQAVGTFSKNAQAIAAEIKRLCTQGHWSATLRP